MTYLISVTNTILLGGIKLVNPVLSHSFYEFYVNVNEKVCDLGATFSLTFTVL